MLLLLIVAQASGYAYYGYTYYGYGGTHYCEIVEQASAVQGQSQASVSRSVRLANPNPYPNPNPPLTRYEFKGFIRTTLELSQVRP